MGIAEEGVSALVFDNGSGLVKAGSAGVDAPQSVFPNIIGRPRHDFLHHNGDITMQDCYAGDAARSRRGVLSLRHPVNQGIVTQWDDMEKILHHTFYNELHVNPSEHPVLLTEPHFNPRTNKETMAKILFEKFDVPAVCFHGSALLSLYASGRTKCGIVVESGEGVTQVVPISEGSAVQHATSRGNLAGRDLTEHLVRMLAERGHRFTTSGEMESVREMKEKLAYVAPDFERELQTNKDYELPDGQVISGGAECFSCGEVMFKPYIIGKEEEGVHDIVLAAINKCQPDLCRQLYQNIVLSGGTTMLPGMAERMSQEITALAPQHMKVKVVAPPQRKYSAWIGGSIIASLSIFHSQMLIYQSEYKESGVGLVHRKCF